MSIIMTQEPGKRLDLTLPWFLTPYVLAGTHGEVLYRLKQAEKYNPAPAPTPESAKLPWGGDQRQRL